MNNEQLPEETMRLSEKYAKFNSVCMELIQLADNNTGNESVASALILRQVIELHQKIDELKEEIKGLKR